MSKEHEQLQFFEDGHRKWISDLIKTLTDPEVIERLDRLHRSVQATVSAMLETRLPDNDVQSVVMLASE